jgi:hypothetical protein
MGTFAYSNELMQSFTQTSGTNADVSTQPFDNCHTIIILNTDGTNSVRVGIVANGVGLTAANSALIPAGATLTLRIGTYEYRPFGRFVSATRLLRLLASAATPVVNFTYLNSTGNTPP